MPLHRVIALSPDATDGIGAHPLTDLVQAAQAGNLLARDQLLATCATSVRAVLRPRQSHSRVAATELDDAVQETMLDLLRGMPSFRARSDREFRAWLTKVARHALGTLQRRTRTGKARTFWHCCSDREIDVNAAVDGDGSPRQLAEQRERRRAVRAAIEQLPRVYRAVLRLHELAELRCEVIAARLGRTPAAVKKAVERGRALLAVHLVGRV